VNTARGEIIVEEDLISVAMARPDLTFCLDVLSGEPEGKQMHSPLLDMENVVVTPHICGCTYESNHKAAQIACQLLKNYIGERN
jgi:D-3-phosphoglycerate dehydrogenase